MNRSPRGSRCSTIAASSNGANVHVTGSLEVVHHEVKHWSFKKEHALKCVSSCFRKAKEIYREPIVLVIDNVQAHSSIEEILLKEDF